MRTKCFEPLQKLRASNLLLTVPGRYFCCGSSMIHVIYVCIWSSAITVAHYASCFVLFCNLKKNIDKNRCCCFCNYGS